MSTALVRFLTSTAVVSRPPSTSGSTTSWLPPIASTFGESAGLAELTSATGSSALAVTGAAEADCSGAASVWPAATMPPAATAATIARPRTVAEGGGRRCVPGTATTRRGIVRSGSSAWAPLGERWRAKTYPSRQDPYHPRPTGFGSWRLGTPGAPLGFGTRYFRDRSVTG